MNDLELRLEEAYGDDFKESYEDFEECEEELYKDSITSYDLLKDISQSMVTEAIEHFIGTRSREIKDDARYLTKDELSEFKKEFVKVGGDLKTLHISKTPIKENRMYEVCRKAYYDSYREYFYS